MNEKDYNTAYDAIRLLAALLLVPLVLVVAWLILVSGAGFEWVFAWLVASLPMGVILAPDRID